MLENENSSASDLDGLPAIEREETEEILNEIEGEEKNIDPAPAEGDDPELTKDKKPEEGKPAEGDEPEEGKDKESEEGKEPVVSKKEGKKPGLMPTWVHERAKADSDKKIEDLTEALRVATTDKSPSSDDKSTTPAEQASLEEGINKVAEEHKLSPELVKSLVELGMKHGGKLPADIQEKLANVDNLQAVAEATAEESAFNSAFDVKVLPLIKEEYGDLEEDTISEIRKTMMEQAYGGAFSADTPYSVIYKGVDAFREFKRTPASSAENSRGGTENTPSEGAEGADEDGEFGEVTEADIDAMSGETFDRYTKWAEGAEKKGNL